ncbi:MAG: hypothetical protein LBE35_00195 [Clostridiales bacterium]|jgi:hypothetical protein|nr:hypothetical protein [Clostridiales bacterium]
MQRPRLRDNRGRGPFELYPLGQIPAENIYEIGKWFVYRYSVGNKDINGSEWGDIFANGINGEHLSSPLGLADVVHENMAWSTKTVKHNNPHSQQKVRVISGRCSPDYSYGITDPHEDIQKTGTAVLSIYNERINIAKDRFEPLRAIILIRNFERFEFVLFEDDVHRYVTSEYRWRKNSNGNLQGHDSAGRHCFTWQPHGSQFTVLYDVPSSAIKFTVKQPPVLDFDKTLMQIGFDESWIKIL